MTEYFCCAAAYQQRQQHQQPLRRLSAYCILMKDSWQQMNIEASPHTLQQTSCIFIMR